MVVQILILLLLSMVVPVVTGGIFAGSSGNGGKKGILDKEGWLSKLLFRWIGGQMCLWAGFHMICVPFILRGGNFGEVVKIYVVYMAALILLSLAREIRFLASRNGRGKGTGPVFGRKRKEEGKKGRTDKVALALWCCVGCLLLFQLVAACFLAYEEGDDAFYVAISTSTVDADTMYQKLPYTGGPSVLDARHALAPFPIWVAFMAKLSGMHPAMTAQVALPVVLIGMAYGVLYLLGSRLCGGDTRKLPLFLVLAECLVLFGGYSTYSAENFLLVRTAQGKAVLASIVIPFLLLLLCLLLERCKEGGGTGAWYWCLFALTMVTSCLCSTLGSFLTCLFVGIVGLCGAVCFKRWKILPLLAGCCVIPMGMVLLYFWMR